MADLPYFIEMGQGIIGKPAGTSSFSVITSALYSCTLICGHNSSTKNGGAFHYPASYLENEKEGDQEAKEIVSAINQWITTLKPDAVTLLFPSFSGDAAKAEKDDIDELAAWLVPSKVHKVEKVPGIVAASMMVTSSGSFIAASVTTLLDKYDLKGDAEDNTDVSKLAAGKHPIEKPEFVLFGRKI